MSKYIFNNRQPELTYVFWYDQVSKCGRHRRHCNVGELRCRQPTKTHKWNTLKLLQERCLTVSPWLVTAIGALPKANYEREKFALQDPPAYVETYDYST